jgi:hypothetical protein
MERLQPLSYKSLFIFVVEVLIWLVHSGAAEDVPPPPNSDCAIDGTKILSPAVTFDFGKWIRRGECIRSSTKSLQCESNLEYVMNSLTNRAQLQYSSAATIITLVPTMGVLFGTPNAEIWALLRLLPLGGVMAMLLSFGGSLMSPVLDEYTIFGRQHEPSRSVVMNLPKGNSSSIDHELHQQLDFISGRIEDKVRSDVKIALPVSFIIAGLCAMVILWAGAIAGMAIVSAGSIFVPWCMMTWWIHMWYIVGKLTPMKLPFTTSNLVFHILMKQYLIGLLPLAPY